MAQALFDEPCADEKATMLKIAHKFNYGLKDGIVALFDKANEKGRIYELDELKNSILEWIKR